MFLNSILNKRFYVTLGISAFILNMFFCFCFNLQKSNVFKTPIIISSNDSKGYYEYLPWLVHNKNLNYQNGYSYPTDSSRYIKYSYGVAFCYLPMYAISSLFINQTLNYNTVTSSENVIICVTASIYLAIAMVLLFKLLSLYFNNVKHKIITIVLIYSATNLFHYSVMDVGMSHLYSFFAITGFLWAILTYLKYQKQNDVFYILFFLFLIIAIRPINAIVTLPFIFYVNYQLKKYWLLFFCFITIAFSFSLQIVLWRWQCGTWIFSSYQNEGFYWLSPEFTNVFFSFRKGLFIYTPLLVLSFIGLLLLFKQSKPLSICIIIAMFLFCMVVTCWWHWPFGDSFGHRAFIDVYAFAAIGLLTLFTQLTKLYFKIIVYIILFCFTVLNVIQTYQYNQGIISAEYMTKEKYIYQFLQIGSESRNCLGGCNDIFPCTNQFFIHQDSISFINMDFDDFSEPLVFQFDAKNNGTYIDISLTKIENCAYESAKAKVYVQITDSAKNITSFTAFLLNQTPNDCNEPNSRVFNYQVTMPALSTHDKLQVFITNPERENFVIKNFKAVCYFMK